MNTVTLLQLHEKAIKTLECIDKAKERVKDAEKIVNEHSGNPFPWSGYVLPYYQSRFEVNKAIIKRLKLYYCTALRIRIEEAQERAFKNQ